MENWYTCPVSVEGNHLCTWSSYRQVVHLLVLVHTLFTCLIPHLEKRFTSQVLVWRNDWPSQSQRGEVVYFPGPYVNKWFVCPGCVGKSYTCPVPAWRCGSPAWFLRGEMIHLPCSSYEEVACLFLVLCMMKRFAFLVATL